MRGAVLAVVVASCGRISFDPLDPLGGDARLAGDSAIAPDAADTVPNRVFIAPIDVFADQLGGLASPDSTCQTTASQAGVAGTYLAFLAYQGATAQSRLTGARGWVRMDGQPVADLPTELFTKMYYPVAFDVHGAVIVGASVLTGMNADGTIGTNCADFTMNGLMSCGSPTGTAGNFGGSLLCVCNNVGFSVYCFGTDHETPGVAPIPTAGRLAFVSSTTWTSGGGLASADALCASDATAAGLAGTFRALLATTTATGPSRFSTAGAPWVRPDGVPIAATAVATFVGSSLASPLDQTADGLTYVDDLVFTGSSLPSSIGTTSETCSNWTSASSALGPQELGRAGYTDEWWGLAVGDCSVSVRLYCLQV